MGEGLAWAQVPGEAGVLCEEGAVRSQTSTGVSVEVFAVAGKNSVTMAT